MAFAWRMYIRVLIDREYILPHTLNMTFHVIFLHGSDCEQNAMLSRASATPDIVQKYAKMESLIGFLCKNPAGVLFNIQNTEIGAGAAL